MKEKGWRIPKTDGLKVKEKVSVELGGISVIRKNFSMADSDVLISLGDDKYCKFFALSIYLYKDKTFAIDGNCGLLHIARKMRFPAAAVTRYAFVDEDGDGKFESRYNYSSGTDDFKLFVPSYLTKK